MLGKIPSALASQRNANFLAEAQDRKLSSPQWRREIGLSSFLAGVIYYRAGILAIP